MYGCERLMNRPGMPPCTPYLHVFILPAGVVGTNWDVAANRLGVSTCVFFFFFKFLYLRSEGVGEPVHPLSNQMSAHTIMFLTMGIRPTQTLDSWCFLGCIQPICVLIQVLEVPLPPSFLKTCYRTRLRTNNNFQTSLPAITLIRHFTDMNCIINSRAVLGF